MITKSINVYAYLAIHVHNDYHQIHEALDRQNSRRNWLDQQQIAVKGLLCFINKLAYTQFIYSWENV